MQSSPSSEDFSGGFASICELTAATLARSFLGAVIGGLDEEELGEDDVEFEVCLGPFEGPISLTVCLLRAFGRDVVKLRQRHSGIVEGGIKLTGCYTG